MHFAAYRGTPLDWGTEVDKASEVVIIATLTKAFPDHCILAEEGEGESQWAHTRGHIHDEMLARLRQADPDCPMQNFVLH